MSALLAFQREVAAYVHGHTRACPSESSSEGSVPSGVRWSVYRNNARASVRRALEASFSITRTLLGEARFSVRADQFASEHPPTCGWLSSYGGAFVEFLAADQAEGTAADIARVEWAMRCTALAPREDPVELHRLSRLGLEDLAEVRLRLCSGARWIQVRSQAFAAWPHASGVGRPSPPEGITTVLVARSREGLAIERVAPADLHWLALLAAPGASGLELARALAASGSSADAFFGFVAAGLIVVDAAAWVGEGTEREVVA